MFSKFLTAVQTRLATTRNEVGAVAVEYILLVGGIALVLGVAAAAFGGEITTRLSNIL